MISLRRGLLRLWQIGLQLQTFQLGRRITQMKRMFVAVSLLFLLFNYSFAIDMSTEINAATAKMMPQVIQWRRLIYEHPELSNREFNTSKLVAAELQRLGIEVRTGIAK